MVAVVTHLCWTAPHQSPHSGPSDRTGSAWSHPLPPPQSWQPLWSTRTPPPSECRHLMDKCSRVISAAPLVVCCHAQPRGASLGSGRRVGREKTKKRSPAHTAQLGFISACYLSSSPLVSSHLFHVNSACLVSFVLKGPYCFT